ncbi:fasciclin domain-containing protein, partial [Flavobacteriales bacterium]|nr:fasciclin domain-containing protein [Flavobacteriales bacterium]
SGTGPFTVFAPTDAAFDAVDPMTLLSLLLDNDALAAVLTYHVAGDSVMSTDLSDGQVITTLNGGDVTVTIDGGSVMINNAMVIVADLVGSNGVVHVIDAVLLPPPPAPATVVDIIVNSPDHTVLETAVIAAELADDLSAEGPFTVFAPTDAAIAALPAGALEALLADPTGALAEVLLYHVVGAAALSTDLSDGQLIATLQGGDVEVSIDGMGVMINDANVIVADLVADNGVVHVIDAVLSLPTGVEAVNLSSLFEVYPNPTTDVLRWNGIAVDRIQVLDAQGRVRIQTSNPANSIDLSALESGVFMVVIEAEGQRAVKSVLKH